MASRPFRRLPQLAESDSAWALMHRLARPRCSSNASACFRYRCRSTHPACPRHLQRLECQGTLGFAIAWRNPTGPCLFSSLQASTPRHWALHPGKQHQAPIDNVDTRLYLLGRSMADSRLTGGREGSGNGRSNERTSPISSSHSTVCVEADSFCGSCREVSSFDALIRSMASSIASNHSPLSVSYSVICAHSPLASDAASQPRTARALPKQRACMG